ncbi:MAG TPA: lytic transglycosylase domain-containing protein [Solirubrobacteraceae bacterium]|nr:lytic transglycosylase domain-containing protein [Solirubrobacteraceae bacterium]
MSAASTHAGSDKRPGRPAVALLGGAVALAVTLTLGAVTATLGGRSTAFDGETAAAEEGAAGGYGISTLARAEIPPEYLRLYLRAAARYGLDWAILAGIGRVECDHGRDPVPACTQEGAVNSAGAGGPMQFLASTWAEYGVDAAGDGLPDRWNPADAIFGAANYLRASGAPGNYREAIYAYNHAGWYVEEVESWAAKYSAPALSPISSEGEGGEGRGGGSEGAESSGGVGVASNGVEGAGAEGAAEGASLEGAGAEDALEGADTRLASETATPVRFISGVRAVLAPDDGHVALVPAGVPAAVQAMVVAGNELQDLPYGPDGHPNPLGAPDEDCSSTVNYVLYRAGVRPLAEIVRENPLAQDYVNWGAPGPGRWVTIYATNSPTPHVFIVIAGLRLDTSHNGTDVGPNRNENGPRWRILDHIPTWAHWSVRHPPGL